MMEWVIGTGVAVSLLIVLVLIVRRPFARMFGARAAYALWLLPFIRLVMPEVTIPRIFPQFANSPAPETSLPSDIVLTPEMIATLQTDPTFMSQVEPYMLPAALGIWALGAIGFFLFHWVAQASLMDRLTYESEPASVLRNEVISAAQAVGLKRVPQVRISDEKAGPLVAGFLRPIVILPDNFMTAFSPQQRYYALMHELMHVKRGDVGVALAWLAFRAVNWPNPLVHYAAKHFRSDQEAACDASVLSAMGDSQSAVSGYAETLIHAAKAAVSDGRASPHSSQLALTIHHPLKERLMILGTHRKTSNWRSRTAAAVMIIGAATLSAPLIQADAHPEEELAGKAENHAAKSVIKRHYNKDGKNVSEHYEITVEGDEVKAYSIDVAGRKTLVDVEDIEGVDVADLKAGRKGFTISDKDGVKFMSRKDFKEWAETEYPEWKKEDFASWAEGDFATWADEKSKGKLVLRDESGETRFEFKSLTKPPTPPAFPKFSSRSENVFVIDSDDFPQLKGLKNLEALKGLKGLEKLKALKGLEGLEGLAGLEALEGLEGLDALDNIGTFIFSANGDSGVKLKMRMTESKLAAARAMLEDTRIAADDSREMAKAKRELEKARKALKAAEQALQDAK